MTAEGEAPITLVELATQPKPELIAARELVIAANQLLNYLETHDGENQPSEFSRLAEEVGDKLSLTIQLTTGLM